MHKSIIESIKIFIYRKLASFYNHKAHNKVTSMYIKYNKLSQKHRKYENKANDLILSIKRKVS